MNMLFAWIESGWVAFFAMAVLWVETAVLCAVAEDRLARFKALFGGALAGSCLLGALGCAMAGQSVVWVLAFLTLSLFAHVLDVASRLKPHAGELRRSTE